MDPGAVEGVATVSRRTTFTPVASTRVVGDVGAGLGTFLVRLLRILRLTLSWTILLILIVGLYYENWDPSSPRNITSQRRKPKKMSRMLRSTDNRPRRGKLLPEHIDLGLRLTVGEDVIQKPFLESKHGDGKFPEMQPHTEAAPNPYYPSLPGSPGNSYSIIECTIYIAHQ